MQVPPIPDAAPVPFNNTNPLAWEWTEKAFDLVNAGQLHVAITTIENIKVARAQGECPYCGDELSDERTLTAVIEGSEGVLGAIGTALGRRRPAAPKIYEDVTFTCGCSVVHPGGTGGAPGCGTHFRLGTPVQS